MIKTNTVFILGAGASQPYGLPVGSVLTANIIQAASDKMLENFVKQLGFTGNELLTMTESLSRSTVKSIDSWLERNTDFIKLGKISIAREIANREAVVSAPQDCDWYTELWNEYLLPECRKAKDILENKVKFITFNYDRSLEHFLLLKLANTFRAEREEIGHEIINQIEIIHVHGQAGYLPWQKNAPENLKREYCRNHTWETAQRISESIQVVCETDGQTPAYLRAKEVLKEATYIYFLGFGYHDENLRRLNISDALREKQNISNFSICGSAFSLPERDRMNFLSVNNPFGWTVSLGHHTHNILDFMRTTVLKY